MKYINQSLPDQDVLNKNGVCQATSQTIHILIVDMNVGDYKHINPLQPKL